jgi:Uma2 family endonuclease
MILTIGGEFMVATKLITIEELVEMEQDDEWELVEGEIEPMSPAGPVHMMVVSRINEALVIHLHAAGGAKLITGDGGFAMKRNPDSVLVPDLTVMTDEQISALMTGTGTFTGQLPLIAIEIKPPSDRESLIAKKLSIYLESGVQEVWWVRPERQTVTIHRPDSAPEQFTGHETLTTPLLPDFALPLHELFSGIV